MASCSPGSILKSLSVHSTVRYLDVSPPLNRSLDMCVLYCGSILTLGAGKMFAALEDACMFICPSSSSLDRYSAAKYVDGYV